MGFDDRPDPLPLGLFEPFRGQAEAGSKPPFTLNPLVEGVVGLQPFRIGTTLSAVQQTGRLMAGFWSDAPYAPRAEDPTVRPIDALAELGKLIRDRGVVPAERSIGFLPRIRVVPVREGTTRPRIVAHHL